MTGLNQLAAEMYASAREKGFYQNHVEVGEQLMLVVSELSEALDADRRDLYTGSMLDSVNEDHFVESFETIVKDTFEDEMADALIRLLGYCAYRGIDIERHIEMKMRYNATRPFMHRKKY